MGKIIVVDILLKIIPMVTGQFLLMAIAFACTKTARYYLVGNPPPNIHGDLVMILT